VLDFNIVHDMTSAEILWDCWSTLGSLTPKNVLSPITHTTKRPGQALGGYLSYHNFAVMGKGDSLRTNFENSAR